MDSELCHLLKSDYEDTKYYTVKIWQGDIVDYIVLPIDKFFIERRDIGIEVLRETSVIKYVPQGWMLSVETERMVIDGLVDDLLLANKPVHDRLVEIGWLEE